VAGAEQLIDGFEVPPPARLHRALGFEPAGFYRQVGWKHHAWHDGAWMQKTIATNDDPPREPC
jgi:L-amino acid N-acyltransferase YncA